MKNLSGRPTSFQGKRGPERSERRKAADEAGLSRHQMYQCLAIARIPQDEFDRLIDSADPPTLEELVRFGRSQQKKPKARRRCPHCGGEIN